MSLGKVVAQPQRQPWMGGNRSDSSCSSGEEDGDDEWRAAIDSVASVATFRRPNSRGLHSSSHGRSFCEDEEEENHKPSQNIKHYQIKAQKLLDEILEKTIEVVSDTFNIIEKNPTLNDGVRLFKHAPHGIVFDHTDELHGPKKKPKILPGEELDEKSKKFGKQLRSVAVDGADIITASRVACQRSLAKLEAREAGTKAAAKREEERVAKLKKIRGERWLPSVARDMQVNTQKWR